MKYKEELIRSMDYLADDNRTIFVGQSTRYKGHALYTTILNIPLERRIEMPVVEDLQMGFCTGLALEGYIPISIFPRIDFFMCCMNQLVNHLDKFEIMTEGFHRPRQIIRTAIGSTYPLNGGYQHTQNHISGLREILTNVDVVELVEPEQIFPAFKHALEREDSKSTILVEWGDYYNEK
jgi:pyruvate/2-oxoglutarate/acetoin dehydrogenase E1 component